MKNADTVLCRRTSDYYIMYYVIFDQDNVVVVCTSAFDDKVFIHYNAVMIDIYYSQYLCSMYSMFCIVRELSIFLYLPIDETKITRCIEVAFIN